MDRVLSLPEFDPEAIVSPEIRPCPKSLLVAGKWTFFCTCTYTCVEDRAFEQELLFDDMRSFRKWKYGRLWGETESLAKFSNGCSSSESILNTRRMSTHPLPNLKFYYLTTNMGIFHQLTAHNQVPVEEFALTISLVTRLCV